jgi:magnesium transporter
MSKYRKISSRIQELIISNPKAASSIRWLNIINPGKEELDFLRKLKKYGFDFRDLRSSYSQIQAERPSIEKRGNYFFLIFNFPVFHDDEIIAAEIDFFIAHGLLITLHDGRLKIFNDFFNTARKDDSSLSVRELPSAAVLLGEILKMLINDCYAILDKNSQKINELEKMIFSGRQKESVAETLSLERNIINLRRIMISHKNILKKMIEMKSSIIPSSILTNIYARLVEQVKQVWELSESQKETINALRETNESLLDFHTNNIIKTLTIVSVIFTPLMFIVSLLTMSVNKGMPFVEMPNGFWLVSLGLFIIGLFMLVFFAKKKWL